MELWFEILVQKPDYSVLAIKKTNIYRFCKDWSKAGDPSAVIYIY